MQLTFDPEHIRGLITAWRAATDIRIPMDERLKVYFMARRGEMLANFSITAAGWTMLLHAWRADTAQEPALQALMADVAAFKEWADEGMQELQRMGLQETISDGGEHMPDDPQVVAALRKMLGIPKPPDREP